VNQTTWRTHRCGELRAAQLGAQVRLGGWVHRRRDLGGIVFIDLRDRDGVVQVAIGPAWASAEVLARAQAAGIESVLVVEGAVVARPPDMKNPELATGDIEVHATTLEVVGPAETPAIPWRAAGEELPCRRAPAQHRHLDLRRPSCRPI
jgi:aspartyl-tRNA synthetase